jgi:hypothetical protein
MSPSKAEYDATIDKLVKEGASYEEVKAFKQNQILIKSINLVKEHAHDLEERRHSPERYNQVKNKVSSINPYASPGKRRPRPEDQAHEQTAFESILYTYAAEQKRDGSGSPLRNFEEFEKSHSPKRHASRSP